MVRQLLFVVVSGFLVVFGGVAAVNESASATPTTNGTESVVSAVGAVSSGLNGVLLGLMGLVLLTAVVTLR